MGVPYKKNQGDSGLSEKFKADILAKPYFYALI